VVATLSRALLREDAGFHAYQMLEAGVRQFGEWGNTGEGRHILIAVARYLAAHSPTECAVLQTPILHGGCVRNGRLPDSLFLEKFSLIRLWKFPVLLRREFRYKLLNPRVDQTRKSPWMAGFSKIPC
jgi:hypothetical protein